MANQRKHNAFLPIRSQLKAIEIRLSRPGHWFAFLLSVLIGSLCLLWLVLIYFVLTKGIFFIFFIDFSKCSRMSNFTAIGWRQSTLRPTHSEIRYTLGWLTSPPWGMMSTNLSPPLKNSFTQNANGNFQCFVFLDWRWIGFHANSLNCSVVILIYFPHIARTCRITSATQGFTQLQESIDHLVTWLDDAEVRASGGGELENSERLELLQVCWDSELVFSILPSSHFLLGDQILDCQLHTFRGVIL